MALTSFHPQFADFRDDWVTMRDLYRGERAVKARDELYLPATKGMQLDGMNAGQLGREAYNAYKLRAVFHDYVKDGVEHYIGLMHQKPPTIELPSIMEPLREKATIFGEPLTLLLRRINEEQLVTGRVGLMLDMPVIPDPVDPLPYFALYIAETIINWDDGQADRLGRANLNLVVLDESSPIRGDEFNWKMQTKYRVLQLGDLAKNETEGEGKYIVGTFSNVNGSLEYSSDAMTMPMYRGVTLDKIPFVFINTKDITSVPDEPPLLGLGRLALAIYRGEADYRQNLFMQGQDTLVIIGGVRQASTDPSQETPIRTGAGSRIEVETGGDAKYIGVSGSGLPEQRQALENDKTQAETKSGQLINIGSSGSRESGEALKTRLAAQTATLIQIANTGAAALETLLRTCAEWMGANPDDVKVTPNLDFADYNELAGQDLVQYMTARTMGAPLSKESIHAMMVERGVTKMDFQTEMDTIEEENANAPALGTNAGGDPNPPPDPNAPPNDQNPPPPGKPIKTPPGA